MKWTNCAPAAFHLLVTIIALLLLSSSSTNSFFEKTHLATRFHHPVFWPTAKVLDLAASPKSIPASCCPGKPGSDLTASNAFPTHFLSKAPGSCPSWCHYGEARITTTSSSMKRRIVIKEQQTHRTSQAGRPRMPTKERDCCLVMSMGSGI